MNDAQLAARREARAELLEARSCGQALSVDAAARLQRLCAAVARGEAAASAMHAEVLRYAMLPYATLCYAMLCYAVPCCAMLCYAMLCYAVLCYAMLCYAKCYAMHHEVRALVRSGEGGVDTLADGTLVPCVAGTAFVSFVHALDAQRIVREYGGADRLQPFERPHVLQLTFDGLGPGVRVDHAVRVRRPAEPSDVVWKNLGSEDRGYRQLVSIAGMLALSLAMSVCIGGISFLQPKVLARTEERLIA